MVPARVPDKFWPVPNLLLREISHFPSIKKSFPKVDSLGPRFYREKSGGDFFRKEEFIVLFSKELGAEPFIKTRPGYRMNFDRSSYHLDHQNIHNLISTSPQVKKYP